MIIYRQVTTLVLVCALAIATCPVDGIAFPAPAAGEATASPADRLEQLVAPIALYPDALVAQILAGATFPTQIVEADRWLKANSSLQGEALGKAVDAQPWDESVKALTQFPSVLENMSQNLSWTSALGDAFFNDKDGVTAAVQKLRAEALKSGNLKTTKEQTVTTQEKIIVIQPANPQVVYVPVYNPTVVYGYPVAVYPGYSSANLAAAAVIGFGIGVAVGAAVWGPCCRWGYSSWGYAWHGGGVTYNRNVYVSHSNVYVNRNSYYKNPNHYPRPTPYNNNTNVNRSGNSNVNRSGNTNNNRSGNTINKGDTNINRGGNTVNVGSGNRSGNTSTPSGGNRGNVQGGQGQGQNRTNSSTNANRGYGQTRDTGTKSSAYSGQTTGGNAAAQQSRGRASTGASSGAAKPAGNTTRSGGNAGGKKR